MDRKRLTFQYGTVVVTTTTSDPDFIFDTKNLVSIEDVKEQKVKKEKISNTHIRLKDYIQRNIDEKPVKK